MLQWAADFIGENKIVFIVPQPAGRKLAFCLICSLLTKNFDDTWSNSCNALLSVLCFIEEDIA